jgi:hypothetical protein
MKTNRYIADIRFQEPDCHLLARTNPSLAATATVVETIAIRRLTQISSRP